MIFDVAYGIEEEPRFPDTAHELNSLFSRYDLVTLKRAGIYIIDQFTKYKVSINFNDPEIAAKEMTEIVNCVEAQCPIAKAFGVNNGVGEGVVWKSADHPGDSALWFKTKGKKTPRSENQKEQGRN